MLYKQLTYEERIQIGILLKEKYSIRKIAKSINRDPGTISREIKRNFWDAFRAEYNANCADRKYHTRKKIPVHQPKLKDISVKNYVIEKLKIGWSPEQIAGTMQMEINKSVSHETIYKFVYDQKDLIKLLPQRRKKRLRRGQKKESRAPIIIDRIMIDQRPKSIDKRIEIGHWEADTLEGRVGGSALTVLVERKSGAARIKKVRAKNAENNRLAIESIFSSLDHGLIKSITYDNGVENFYHQSINKQFGIESYFCHAYCSWEKGSVENLNGLIRRFFPKKTDFDDIPESEIERVENLLNNRPRKRHNFKTPKVVMDQGVALQP